MRTIKTLSLTSRGTYFKNQLVSEVCIILEIKQITSTSCSHQTQEYVGRVNGTLYNSLKNHKEYNTQSRWSYYLPYIT